MQFFQYCHVALKMRTMVFILVTLFQVFGVYSASNGCEFKVGDLVKCRSPKHNNNDWTTGTITTVKDGKYDVKVLPRDTNYGQKSHDWRRQGQLCDLPKGDVKLFTYKVGDQVVFRINYEEEEEQKSLWIKRCNVIQVNKDPKKEFMYKVRLDVKSQPKEYQKLIAQMLRKPEMSAKQMLKKIKKQRMMFTVKETESKTDLMPAWKWFTQGDCVLFRIKDNKKDLWCPARIVRNPVHEEDLWVTLQRRRPSSFTSKERTFAKCLGVDVEEAFSTSSGEIRVKDVSNLRINYTKKASKRRLIATTPMECLLTETETQ